MYFISCNYTHSVYSTPMSTDYDDSIQQHANVCNYCSKRIAEGSEDEDYPEYCSFDCKLEDEEEERRADRDAREHIRIERAMLHML